MNRKLLIPIVIAVIAVLGFVGYSFAKPKSNTKQRVNGTTYILSKQFTLNLSGGQYATLTAALLLPPGQSVGVTSATNPPPTGFGSLTDEAEIRAIITNDVTNQPASSLLVARARQALEAKILRDIDAQTDTRVTQIYFTDLAVQ